MTAIDWIIVAIVVVSTLIGLLRGVTREIVSLAGWIGGLVLGYLFAAQLAEALPADWGPWRLPGAALLILVGALIASALVGALLRAMIAAVHLTSLDRLLGAFFGLARAVLVLAVAVVLASTTSMPTAGWWKDSLLLPGLEAGVAFASPLLPVSLARVRGNS